MKQAFCIAVNAAAFGIASYYFGLTVVVPMLIVYAIGCFQLGDWS